MIKKTKQGWELFRVCKKYDQKKQNKVGDLLQPVAKLVGDVTRDLHKLIDPKVSFHDRDDDDSGSGGGHDDDDDDDDDNGNDDDNNNDDDDHVIVQAGEPVCRWEKKKWCEPVNLTFTKIITVDNYENDDNDDNNDDENHRHDSYYDNDDNDYHNNRHNDDNNDDSYHDDNDDIDHDGGLLILIFTTNTKVPTEAAQRMRFAKQIWQSLLHFIFKKDLLHSNIKL